MGIRFGGGNPISGAADDQSQLTFIIELMGLRRLQDRTAVAGLGIGKANEERRRRVRLREFGALVGVVHADTENLPRLINGRQKADFRFAMVRLVVSEGSRLIEASPREEIFQVNITASQTLTEIDQAAFAVYSKGSPAVYGIACEFH